MSGKILVSGAGSGIGRAACRTLAGAGFELLLLGRNADTLEATRRECGDGGHAILVADIRERAQIDEALTAAGCRALYAVIANAGLGGENQPGAEDRWDEIIATNLSGSYHLVNAALPLLRGGSGFRHILIVSSILARLGVPGYTAYCASKAGLLGLMRSWAVELAAERILVNAICPGWVDTAMARQGLQTFADNSGRAFDDIYREQMAHVPLGKMSTPEEIAALCHFLLSGRQTSITGQVLDINNGALMP